MKKRNLKVRALTGCMAVVLFMTSFAPLTVHAEELPIEEVITVEETVVVEETTEEAQTEEPTVVEETTEEAQVEESTVVEEVTEEAQAEESTVVEEVTEEAQVEEPTVVEETTEEAQIEESTVVEETIEEPQAEEPIVFEEEIEEPSYKADVVETVEKDIQLTQTKSKKVIVEYLKSGEKVITTQYFENGVMIKETVFNSQEIVDEISEQQVAEIEEIQRLLEEERQRKAAEEEEKRRLAEEEKKEIEDILNSFNYSSIDEFLDAFFEYFTNTEPGDREYQIVKKTGSAKKADPDVVLKYMKKAYNNGIDGLLKLIPGSDFYRDTVKSLISDVLDLNEGKPQEDLKDLINKNYADLEQDILQGVKETKDNTKTISALTSYGERLDKFADGATSRAISIDEYRKDAELSEAARNVKIANLIGHADDWGSGKNSANIMIDLMSAAQVFKGNTNVDSRDIYSLIYDLHKGDALFVGEAMSQSESKIRSKVNNFLRNCGVVIECLKAHEAVAKLTEEEVNSLDPHTREMYNQIKSDSKSIKSRLRTIAAILLGDKSSDYDQLKTGIFTKAEEYYSKNKTTYIDHGKNNINLKSELNWTFARNLMKEDKINPDMIGIFKRIRKVGLTPADYEKIANQARSLGMTITEYLKYSGFDTKAIDDVCVYLASDIYCTEPEEFLGSCIDYIYRGVTTYTMDEKNPEKSDVVLYSHCKVKLYGWDSTKGNDHFSKAHNQGVGFVFFEMEQ